MVLYTQVKLQTIDFTELAKDFQLRLNCWLSGLFTLSSDSHEVGDGDTIAQSNYKSSTRLAERDSLGKREEGKLISRPLKLVERFMKVALRYGERDQAYYLVLQSRENPL